MGKKIIGKLFWSVGIILTILLFIITILGGKAANFHPESFFLIPFLGIAFPVLYILNLFFLVIWIIQRKIWALFPAIILIWGYFQLQPIFSFSFTKSKEEQGNLRIATYNVAAFNSPISDIDAKELASFLKKEKVDIICMQEFVGNKILTDSLLYSIFAFWPYHFIPIDSTKEFIRPAIFSKYPISERQLILFKDSKNCAISCDINIGKQYIRLFNNHLQTTNLTQIKEKNENDIARKEFYYYLKAQALQQNAYIRAKQADSIQTLIKQSPYPIILCGDFNDPPFSYTYKTMLGNLKDGFVSKGKGYATSYRYAQKIFRIDYIFYSENLKCTKYFTPEFGESDHYPVIMELNM